MNNYLQKLFGILSNTDLITFIGDLLIKYSVALFFISIVLIGIQMLIKKAPGKTIEVKENMQYLKGPGMHYRIFQEEDMDMSNAKLKTIPKKFVLPIPHVKITKNNNVEKKVNMKKKKLLEELLTIEKSIFNEREIKTENIPDISADKQIYCLNHSDVH